VFIIAFDIIFQPKPVCDPHYVVPFVGMLLGKLHQRNLSIAELNVDFRMVESSHKVELLLNFGATSYAASSQILVRADRNNVQLEGMSIIGLISIPGMMTGKILGGTRKQLELLLRRMTMVKPNR
jgi:putative ABC transport system permease protein